MTMKTDESLLVQKLESVTRSFGLDLSSDQEELMVRHLMLVIDKNKKLNLTRITSPEEAIYLHILDSLLLLPYLMKDTGLFLDLGTGAGFPGIPLTIASGWNSVLLDSVGKKASAVNEFLQELGLSGKSSTIACRVEEYASSHKGEFDAVVVRAVAALPTLVEYASPLLEKGGRLVVTKGRPTEDEMSSGDKASSLCGMRRIACEEFDIPNQLGHRTLLVFEKTSNGRIVLPRHVGMAKSKPLA
jgi:16S rRNA (guanine527-N7)-methyltransferase